jgi:hypothetical protein
MNRMRVIDRARLIVVVALLTSVGELRLLAIDRFAFRYRFLFLSADVVWLTPAANLLLDLSAHRLIALDGRWPTLPEVMQRRGYLTAGFVANTVYTSYEPGLNRGFAQYKDDTASPGQRATGTDIRRTGIPDSSPVPFRSTDMPARYKALSQQKTAAGPLPPVVVDGRHDVTHVNGAQEPHPTP